MEKFRWLAGVIAAHTNGVVFGRKRLQKEMLLLQEYGLPVDYRYSIYFYGPYSEGISADLALLKDFDFIDEEASNTADGRTVYKITALPGAECPEIEDFEAVIKQLENTSTEVLELAATFSAFFQMYRDEDEAMRRLKAKKGSLCTPDNVRSAMDLLDDLGLASAA